jgi:hypothetical protein
MADQLATPADLASALQRDVDTATATLLIECATAVVQAAAGNQRILQVVGDVALIMGDSDSWLNLPQVPVTAVSSVMLDGVTLTVGTDYKVFGNRLWRKLGWQTNIGWPMDWQWGTWVQWPPAPPSSTTWFTGPEPSGVLVTNTHGYATGSQDLQLARSAVLSLASQAYGNPSGVRSESIDDYSVQYGAAQAAMDASPFLKAALRKRYGRRGGLVRIG